MTHLTVAALVAVLICLAPQRTASKKVVCYYTNWAQYRGCTDAKFFPKDIDPTLCTHIIYAFAKFEGMKVAPFEWNDIISWNGKGHYKLVTDFKKTNDKLKVMLAVGGWNEGEDGSGFTPVSATDTSRKAFAKNVLAFLKANNFDGFDNDWEYPAKRGNPPESKETNILMMEEIRAEFDREKAKSGKAYLLTMAMGIGKGTMEVAYDFPRLEKVVDFFNLMTYDLHGSWDDFAGHQAAMYKDPSEKDDAATLNIDWVVTQILGQGIDPGKIVLGLPTYGRSHTLKDAQDNKLFAPTVIGNAPMGRCTKEKGFSSYQEICETLHSGVKERWLEDQKSSYYVNGKTWMGYDNPHMIKMKGCYARNKKLGGIMFWALDFDDFNGKFCSGVKYPLIKAGRKGYLDDAQDCSDKGLEKERKDVKDFVDVILPVVTPAPPPKVPENPDETDSKNEDSKDEDSTDEDSKDEDSKGDSSDADTSGPKPGDACTSTKLTAYKANKEAYLQCIHSKWVSRPCPGGLIWDAANGYCNYATLVLKIDDPANDDVDVYDEDETKDNFGSSDGEIVVIKINAAKAGEACEVGDGPSADPTDKAKYLQCLHGKWLSRPCPGGLHFDAGSKACDWPSTGAVKSDAGTTRAVARGLVVVAVMAVACVV